MKISIKIKKLNNCKILPNKVNKVNKKVMKSQILIIIQMIDNRINNNLYKYKTYI